MPGAGGGDDNNWQRGGGATTDWDGRAWEGRRQRMGSGGRGEACDGDGWGGVRRRGGGATTTYGGGARFWSLGARLFWRARVFFGALLFLPVTMVGTLNYE